MTRRTPGRRRVTLTAITAAALVIVSSATAEVSRDVRHLPIRRAILVEDSLRIPGTWVEIWEDRPLTAGAAPGFGDVRVVDALGQVVPAVLWQPDPSVGPLDPIRSESIDWELDEKGQLSFTIALPEEDEALAVELAGSPPLPPFLGSETGEVWRVVQASYPPNQPVRRYGAASPRLVHTTRMVELGRTDYRYLRIRPHSSSNPPLGATVTLYRRLHDRWPEFDVRHELTRSEFHGRRWQAVVEVMGPPEPLAGIRLAPGELEARPVEIEVQDVEGVWRRVDLLDVPVTDAAAPSRSLPKASVTWMPLRGRAVRITVHGADPPNQPVTIVKLLATPSRITFRVPDANEALWLAYGDSHLEQPEWTEAHARYHVLTPRVMLGPEQPNPLYESPRGIEWLRRQPHLVTAVMMGVLVFLGVLVWRWRPGTDE